MGTRVGRLPPTAGNIKQFRVNRPGMEEAIWQPLYDYQTYALAGTTTEYSFFQRAQGGAGVTYADTNMDTGGSLPFPKKMLVTTITVVVFPGTPVNTVEAAAAGVGLNWDDVYTIGKAGWLEFFVGSKQYLIDAPMMKFPPRFRLAGAAAIGAVTTTASATPWGNLDYATFAGEAYDITPIYLEPNQNFRVSLHFPTTTAINADAKIGVILDGWQMRLSQ